MSHRRSSSQSQVDWSTEFMNIHDISKQIVTNAEVLFPTQIDTRVITGKTSKHAYYAALMARDYATPDVKANGVVYRVLAQGPVEVDRRSAVMKLLDDIEKRVAGEVMEI